jgi:hypothetical protein
VISNNGGSPAVGRLPGFLAIRWEDRRYRFAVTVAPERVPGCSPCRARSVVDCSPNPGWTVPTRCSAHHSLTDACAPSISWRDSAWRFAFACCHTRLLRRHFPVRRARWPGLAAPGQKQGHKARSRQRQMQSSSISSCFLSWVGTGVTPDCDVGAPFDSQFPPMSQRIAKTAGGELQQRNPATRASSGKGSLRLVGSAFHRL